MLDGGVGHEGGANVGRHHHDGRARAVAAHLAFGGHCSAFVEAHDAVLSERRQFEPVVPGDGGRRGTPRDPPNPIGTDATYLLLRT